MKNIDRFFGRNIFFVSVVDRMSVFTKAKNGFFGQTKPKNPHSLENLKFVERFFVFFWRKFCFFKIFVRSSQQKSERFRCKSRFAHRNTSINIRNSHLGRSERQFGFRVSRNEIRRFWIFFNLNSKLFPRTRHVELLFELHATKKWSLYLRSNSSNFEHFIRKYSSRNVTLSVENKKTSFLFTFSSIEFV